MRGVPCSCAGPRKERRAYWYVSAYRCNHSRFSLGGFAASDYSQVWCSRCGGIWRTKARYTDELEHRAYSPPTRMT